MAVKKLMTYLNQNHIWYQVIKHPQAYTARQTASLAHVRSKEMAKSVVMKLDGDPVLVVLPAHYKVDFRRIKQITGAKDVELAREEEMEDFFPDCNTGAMPPFGNLYHMNVYADKDLTEDDDIAFNAGSHRELLKMHFRDYTRLVHPKIYDIHRHSRVFI